MFFYFIENFYTQARNLLQSLWNRLKKRFRNSKISRIEFTCKDFRHGLINGRFFDDFENFIFEINVGKSRIRQSF